MTRLGNKITRKTTAGKAVSTGLQKRYDKAVDKVIAKPLKEAAKEKVKTEKKAERKEKLTYAKAFLKGNVFRKPKTREQRKAGKESLRKIAEEKKQLMEEFPDAYRYGGAKMAKGGTNTIKIGNATMSVQRPSPNDPYVKEMSRLGIKPKAVKKKVSKIPIFSLAKKALKKAQTGTSVKAGPLTEKDAEMLSTSPLYKDTNKAYGYFSSGMQPTPSGYRVTPQGRMDDKEKEIRSGATFKKGGATNAKKFAALAPPYNKATAADRIAGAKKKKRK